MRKRPKCVRINLLVCGAERLTKNVGARLEDRWSARYAVRSDPNSRFVLLADDGRRGEPVFSVS